LLTLRDAGKILKVAEGSEIRASQFSWQSIVLSLLPAVVSYLLTYIPKVGPYFNYRFGSFLYAIHSGSRTRMGVRGELPAWALLGIVISVIVITPRVVSWWRTRAHRLIRKTVGELEWDLTPQFFREVQAIEIPGSIEVGEYIQGPYCKSCNRLLQFPSNQSSWGEEPIREIRNPCPFCGHIHSFKNKIGVSDAKVQVFGDLKRQLRTGTLTR
jgi:RNase P subunit RPR2